ncbi:MAG: (deoxy)nucleoside triphosphate pyrophosphohydrolase [Gemmatimonadales bacterium]
MPVLAAVVERGGRYLVCRRSAQKRHGGLWEFPGGKLQSGESLADGLRRELLEELGVEAELGGEPLLEVEDPGSAYLIVFVPARLAGEPVCLEHDALCWAGLDELMTLPLAPSDRRFVRDVLVREA